MTVVLGLDIASSSGFAVGVPGSAPRFGTFRVPTALHADDLGKRFSTFADWLSDIITVHQPKVVAFEAPVPPRGDNVKTTFQTVRLLLGLAAIAEMVAWRHECEVVECHIQTVKKFLAGSGHADKATMMSACYRRGWQVATDHEADACGVWAYTIAEMRLDRKAPEPLAMGAGR